MRPLALQLLPIVFIAAVCNAQEPKSPSPAEALKRGVAFLSREVPRWSRENKCYSCHNNGDGARGLYAALGQGLEVDPQSLAETNKLLVQPSNWQHNGVDEEFSDKRLQTLQFAAALVAAIDARAIREQEPLNEAAELLADEQKPDGSWQLDATAAIGSPVTYGPVLCTVTGRRILAAADERKFAKAVARADGWLLKQQPRTVFDSAALLLHVSVNAAAGQSEEKWDKQRQHCLALLRRSAAPTGGWGPYELSRPEPFDTAIVLLALSSGKPEDSAPFKALIQSGRAYLAQTQFEDGSWPETTRPAGAESYAQRISTAGWCVEALAKTAAAAAQSGEAKPD